MTDKKLIEVFVKSEGMMAGTYPAWALSCPGHECTRTPITEVRFESVLPEIHKHVVDMVEKVTKEKGMQLRILDVSSRSGKLRAFLKGVNKTPTVLVKNKKVAGEITESKLLSLLE